MSELQKIKERIFEDGKIEYILNLLECKNISIEQGGSLFVAARPNGSNPRSVQVRNSKKLGVSVRSKGISGDIYTLISYILFDATTEEDFSSTLGRAKYWLCINLNYYEYIDDFYKESLGNSEERKVPNYNSWLSKTALVEHKNFINVPISEKILLKYGTTPYKYWVDEGILYSTQKEFGVGFDVPSERVTFPVHDSEGSLIGVKGRYVGEIKEIENRYKYIYLEPCNKSLEFFNLHRAKKYILEQKEVFIVEGAKTVMLLWSWGIKNVISIEGDILKPRQIQHLKDLGISIKYIFCWDKDKGVDFIKEETQKLQGRLKYCMYDTGNLLEGKDSPTDKGRDVWEKLYKEYCFKIG